MGEPILDPADVPTLLCGRDARRPGRVPSVETDVGTFEVTAVSMGNPHCVLWVDDVETADVDGIGPVIETHEPSRPRPTSSSPRSSTTATIRLRVWERGCGRDARVRHRRVRDASWPPR